MASDRRLEQRAAEPWWSALWYPLSLLGAAVLAFALGRVLGTEGAAAVAAKLPWYVSRAAGITAYLLLSATTVLGLLISTRLLDRWLSRADVYALHEHCSWLALGFTALHAGALLVDRTEPFSVLQVLVPFAASYRPLATGLGVLALYLTALITASFYLRARIGQRTWRRLHTVTFGLYVLATAHGLLAGSSTGAAWMQWLYLASGAVVLFLTLTRLLLRPRAARRP